MGGCLAAQRRPSVSRVGGPGDAPEEGPHAWALCQPTRLPLGRFYSLGPKLGEGSSAIVREATRKGTSERFAVKIVRKANLEARDVEALLEEVTILRSLEHPNLIKVFEFLEEPRAYFVVMECVGGGELFDRIARKAGYTEKAARSVFRLLARTIDYLHDQDVVHRDLKLENLLLRDSGDDVTVAIADFGFAAKLSARRPHLTDYCGTPNYMAPEIILAEPYGKPVDMWALGVLTYILLGGYAPFSHNNRMKLFGLIRKGQYQFDPQYWAHVSEEAKDLIRGMLERDPGKRLTATQALQHPWVTQKDYILQQRDLESSKQELRRFNARRKFRASYQAIVAANKLGVVLERLRRLAEGGQSGSGSWSSLVLSSRGDTSTRSSSELGSGAALDAHAQAAADKRQANGGHALTKMPAETRIPAFVQ